MHISGYTIKRAKWHVLDLTSVGAPQRAKKCIDVWDAEKKARTTSPSSRTCPSAMPTNCTRNTPRKNKPTRPGRLPPLMSMCLRSLPSPLAQRKAPASYMLPPSRLRLLCTIQCPCQCPCKCQCPCQCPCKCLSQCKCPCRFEPDRTCPRRLLPYPGEPPTRLHPKLPRFSRFRRLLI